MRNLLLIFAVIGLMTSNYASSALINNSERVILCEDKCHKKDGKHKTRCCKREKTSCKKEEGKKSFCKKGKKECTKKEK